jgi:hypothetical protein
MQLLAEAFRAMSHAKPNQRVVGRQFCCITPPPVSLNPAVLSACRLHGAWVFDINTALHAVITNREKRQTFSLLAAGCAPVSHRLSEVCGPAVALSSNAATVFRCAQRPVRACTPGGQVAWSPSIAAQPACSKRLISPLFTKACNSVAPPIKLPATNTIGNVDQPLHSFSAKRGFHWLK